MNRPGIHVVKLGGSLLEWEPLRGSFDAWRVRQPQGIWLVVVGGGELAEGVRNLDRRYGLDPAAAHRWCLACMAIQAEIVASLWPELGWWSPPETMDVGEWPIGWSFVDPRRFTLRETSNLPHDWSVTSDSLAAELAIRLGAEELVLLKSASPPSRTIGACAAAGYVDAHLPRLATGLRRLRCVQLRETPPNEHEMTVD